MAVFYYGHQDSIKKINWLAEKILADAQSHHNHPAATVIAVRLG
jgi:hypothetical protein